MCFIIKIVNCTFFFFSFLVFILTLQTVNNKCKSLFKILIWSLKKIYSLLFKP